MNPSPQLGIDLGGSKIEIIALHDGTCIKRCINGTSAVITH